MTFCAKTPVLLLLLSLTYVALAPVGESSDRSDGLERKSDVPVEQLEKLKTDAKDDHGLKAHVEYHRLDSVKSNGELISRLEQHSSADANGEGNPRVHSQAQLDVPLEGVHKVLVQDGSHISVVDGTAPTAPPSDEPTTKVFHGAARLVQPGSATNNPTNLHTAIRRSSSANILKETNGNIDHFSGYSGVQYSPIDMAEYIFWTGDEREVVIAIEQFLQEGMMSKEEAITFLQQIKSHIDYLRAHYALKLYAAEESDLQENARNMLVKQAAAVQENQLRKPGLQSLVFGNSPDIIQSIINKNWDLLNNLSPIPALPMTEIRQEHVKRSDLMPLSNLMRTPDHELDESVFNEEEYNEIIDEEMRKGDRDLLDDNMKMKLNEFVRDSNPETVSVDTFQEVTYQLSKMLFFQSLGPRNPATARMATQRFMAFLELETKRGLLSRTVQKKLLDSMIEALDQVYSEHAEILRAHEDIGGNTLVHPFLENGSTGPILSHALLGAYKDELQKGPPQLRFPFDGN